ncbi:MAG: hypothetical protein M9894_10160 [Planctomycetes bacterium]|nr:hypothetical protein [Planctomycetota bacterium]
MTMEEADDRADAGERPKGDASEKQLNFIRSLQKRMNLDDAALEEVLTEVCGAAALEDLGRREASEVIDELQVRAREQGIDLDAQPKASEKQVSFMKQLKRRAHMTDDEFQAFLQDRAGVTDAADVGKRDASAIIDELLKKADGAKAGGGGKPAGGKPAGGGGRSAPARKTGGAAPKKAAPAPRPRDEDDDRPPERGPPPGVDDYEPGSFDDGPDDEDLDRDPGREDDDLPF